VARRNLWKRWRQGARGKNLMARLPLVLSQLRAAAVGARVPGVTTRLVQSRPGPSGPNPVSRASDVPPPWAAWWDGTSRPGQPWRVVAVDARARAAYRDHLLRLDAPSRNRRFGGGVSDTGLERHAAGWNPRFVAVAVDASGAWRGVVEVHGADAEAEIALSIEAPCRGLGWGRSAIALAQAWGARMGIPRLACTIATHNPSMVVLARGAGGRRLGAVSDGWQTWALPTVP